MARTIIGGLALCALLGGLGAAGPAGAAAGDGGCRNEYREAVRWQRVGHPGKGPVQARKVREERRVCGPVAQEAWHPAGRTRTAERDR
jgi:hypothetical protein